MKPSRSIAAENVIYSFMTHFNINLDKDEIEHVLTMVSTISKQDNARDLHVPSVAAWTCYYYCLRHRYTSKKPTDVREFFDREGITYRLRKMVMKKVYQLDGSDIIRQIVEMAIEKRPTWFSDDGIAMLRAIVPKFVNEEGPGQIAGALISIYSSATMVEITTFLKINNNIDDQVAYVKSIIWDDEPCQETF